MLFSFLFPDSNREKKTKIDKVREMFSQLKIHSQVQMVRAKQLSTENECSAEQSKHFLATSKELSAEIRALESQLNEMVTKTAVQAEQTLQNSVWILSSMPTIPN